MSEPLPGPSPAMTCDQAQRHLTQMFEAAGHETAAVDARLILCAALGVDRLALICDPERPIGSAAEKIFAWARRRSRGEPVSRILGRREFWSLQFAIDRDVLDPRPETETLVETVIAARADRRDAPLRVLDLGVGSGAILAALLTEFPQAFGIGVDLSRSACRMAMHNLGALGLASRACIFCGDWTKALASTFDVIVSNPPYIARDDIITLAADVRDHDPRLALDGGADGLAAYRLIATDLDALLAPEGMIALELGVGQADDVLQILIDAGFVAVQTTRDIAGQERVISAQLHPQL